VRLPADIPQSGLDMGETQAARQAVPSGADVPEGPQHTWPAGQSPPKQVTAFAAVHVATSEHDTVGAAMAAGRTAQHTCGAVQLSC
jgi:hypothetical protein